MRFHDLRHTYASLMAHQGEDLYRVSRWMGHSTIAITADLDTHLYESEDDALQQRMAAACTAGHNPDATVVSPPAPHGERYPRAIRLDWRALNRKPTGWRGWALFVVLTFAGAATMGLILGQERTRILWVSTGCVIGVVVGQVFRAASGSSSSAGPSSPPPQRPD